MGTEGLSRDFWENLRNWKTHAVRTGSLVIGGSAPLRIQSMTSTDTRNIEQCLKQARELAARGCELIRATTQGKKELEALATIRERLHREGIKVPIAADVHFHPELALEAASRVDKVRINPGNYGLNKTVNSLPDEEQFRIQQAEFSRLIEACKKTGTALRIGVNHGSLSERILIRYGNSPQGMAESAMEFLRVCKSLDFDQVVVSMKSSNTRVMVHATRLLVWMMMQEKMDFPLHLGVTEAGEGEDGRIRSAVGLASLLTDGIGDTIRVSLTEDPAEEIPVARKIARYSLHPPTSRQGLRNFPAFEFSRRSRGILPSGMGRDGVLLIGSTGQTLLRNGKQKNPSLPDLLFDPHPEHRRALPEGPGIIRPYSLYSSTDPNGGPVYPLLGPEQYPLLRKWRDGAFLVEAQSPEQVEALLVHFPPASPGILVIGLPENHPGEMLETCFRLIGDHSWQPPVVLRKTYRESFAEDLVIRAACELGPWCLDGLVDGLWIEPAEPGLEQTALSAAAGILQASRLRMFRTEFISCPSCGRTLFDIRQTTARVKEHTGHLTGLRIAVMGCIVNGPGEMADADYGYVGAGPGRVNLYRRKTLVQKNIPEDEAIPALVRLIREEGDWVDAGE